MFDTLYSITITQAAAALRAGELTSAALVRHALEAVRLHDGTLNAMLRVSASALEEAERCDAEAAQGSFRGPLHGIPLVIKDNIDVRGLPTTVASPLFTHAAPAKADAVAVARLRAAGAVIFGKTNLDELAAHVSGRTSCFGPTVNPWHPERRLSPGGSSSGTATAVAAGYCPGGLGTDTGGSIRQPAALCGCVGLKPTYGRVSRYGVIAYGSSLDQVGPLTRTVEDAALVLSVIAGHDKRDSTSSPRPVDGYADFSRSDLKGVRLGVPREFMAEGLDGPVAKACQDALARARDLGAELVDVSLPHATRHAIAAYYIVAMAEASSNLSRFDGVRYGYRAAEPKNLDDLYCRSRSEGFGQEVQRRILLGTYVLSAGYYDAYYKKAAQVRRLIRQDYLNALGSCDALFGPVSPVTAWKLGSIIDDPLKMYLMDIYTVSLNLAGLPGLSFPVGEADGLPVGMQLIGKDFDEAGILGIGNVLSK